MNHVMPLRNALPEGRGKGQTDEAPSIVFFMTGNQRSYRIKGYINSELLPAVVFVLENWADGKISYPQAVNTLRSMGVLAHE